jgi:hypothetical protein
MDSTLKIWNIEEKRLLKDIDTGAGMYSSQQQQHIELNITKVKHGQLHIVQIVDLLLLLEYQEMLHCIMQIQHRIILDKKSKYYQPMPILLLVLHL